MKEEGEYFFSFSNNTSNAIYHKHCNHIQKLRAQEKKVASNAKIPLKQRIYRIEKIKKKQQHIYDANATLHYASRGGYSQNLYFEYGLSNNANIGGQINYNKIYNYAYKTGDDIYISLFLKKPISQNYAYKLQINNNRYNNVNYTNIEQAIAWGKKGKRKYFDWQRSFELSFNPFIKNVKFAATFILSRGRFSYIVSTTNSFFYGNDIKSYSDIKKGIIFELNKNNNTKAALCTFVTNNMFTCRKIRTRNIGISLGLWIKGQF